MGSGIALVRGERASFSDMPESSNARVFEQPVLYPLGKMVERFFSTQQINLRDVKNDQFILISGPPSCGKTSLLFQFAINSVQECETGNVVFICNRRRLQSNPPCLSQGIDPRSDVFQRIQMKYLEDDEGIKKYFAAFHLHGTYPLAVIIDDFGDYFQEKNCQERFGNARGRDLAMVRVLALCQDAINHANEKFPTRWPMTLILSDTHHGEIPRFLFIYKRWINNIFTIKGDGSGSYLLKSSSSAFASRKIAKYSTALQYLVLEGLTEDLN